MTSSVIQRLVQGRLQNNVFVTAVEQTAAQCQRLETHATLVMIELQSSPSHLVGQRSGETAAQTILDITAGITAHIQPNLRSTDQVFPCQHGQVAVLLPDTHMRDAVCLAERLRTRLDELSHNNAKGKRLFSSIGVAQRLASESPQDWINRATHMREHAKAMGQSWLSFDPASDVQTQTAGLHEQRQSSSQSLYRLGVAGA